MLSSFKTASIRMAGEHLHGAVEKLSFPLRNLIGMDIELLRQLGERLLSLHGC